MLKTNKKYILGLSGGADSVFLFCLLIKQGIKNFVACHVNYNFRSDSKKDLKLVQKLCSENNIKLFVANISQNYKKLNVNFESWARKTRYDFFCKILKTEKADAVLVAHNLNDHIETYIMQTSKNKTVKYHGIKNETFYNGVKILRPILNLRKSEIIDDLIKKNIDFIIDSTNYDLNYERNRVRSLLKEEEFEKYLTEIEALNKKDSINESVLNALSGGKELNLKVFGPNRRLNELVLYRYLEKNGIKDSLYVLKKAFIKETLKQLTSKKSLIEIKKGNFVLIKNYEKLLIVSKKEIETFESTLSEELVIKFNLQDIQIKNFSSLIITNDWKKYQSIVTFEGKSLSKIYRNKKTDYLKRYKNILVFDKTNKILLNKIVI